MEILERDIQRAKVLVKKGIPGAKQNLDILLKYKSNYREVQNFTNNTNCGPWKRLDPKGIAVPERQAIYETMKNEQLLNMDLKK